MANRREYWSGHLAAIEAEGVTTKAYAEREGLAVGALYAWRRRLKNDGQPAQEREQEAPGFVAVQLPPPDEPQRCTLTLGAGMKLELSQLPNPDWLAALSAAITERTR